jgi:Rrf2 family protein
MEQAMKLTTRTRYGLRSLFYLANQNHNRAVPVREIAKEEEVSADYLEHLLHALKGAGLVKSIRGATGGFKLAKPAEEITLKDVFKALGEKIEPVWCMNGDKVCHRAAHCNSRPVWKKLESLLEEFTSNTTLADTVGVSREKETAD